MMARIKVHQADRDLPLREYKAWDTVGNIRKLLPKHNTLLRRLQTAYQAAYGGKQPNLSQTLAIALHASRVALERYCKRLETTAANRAALEAHDEPETITPSTPAQ